MPHLSPMLWALSSIMFLLILIIYNSSLWWSQSPTFPSMPKTTKNFNNPMWVWN